VRMRTHDTTRPTTRPTTNDTQGRGGTSLEGGVTPSAPQSRWCLAFVVGVDGSPVYAKARVSNTHTGGVGAGKGRGEVGL
jgi:hypothetical protein